MASTRQLSCGMASRLLASTMMVAGASAFVMPGSLVHLGVLRQLPGLLQSRSSRSLGILMAERPTHGKEETHGRRMFGYVLAAAASALVLPSVSQAAEKPGAWAAHSGSFTPEELEGFTKTESGLSFKVVQDGTGVIPKSGQKIKAHYAGYLLATGKKFDASYDRGQPLAFAVGTGQVIKGWDEGLLAMKVGERRILLIPPELGYGNKAVGGGLIPAKSTLVFYVELVTLAS